MNPCHLLTLLINQELSCTSVAVVDRLGQLNGIVQDVVASLLWQILGRCQFHDLLMSSLHGAVTLVQVDDIAVVVTQQLHLDVLWSIQEALDEDCTVAES